MPRTVAYRNDYCLSCDAPGRSIRIRTFDVVHLYFIPVLPIGMWKRWGCARCGNPPHVQPGTRRVFKWMGVGVLALLAVVFWAVPIEPGDETLEWSLRVILPVAFVAALVATIRARPDLNLEERLASLPPMTDTSCPFCNVTLVATPTWHCPRCQIECVGLFNDRRL